LYAWFPLAMEFLLLGPLEVRRDGQTIALGGPKQRALLAILLLSPNRPVSRDRLIEGIWGSRPPASAADSLDSYLSRLRRALGPGRLVREPAGYVLALDAGELDLDRFESSLADAHAAASARERSQILREALALWRGPALADLQFEPFARDEVALLEERRIIALEQRIDADLQGGGGVELVPELEQLVRDNPLRERGVVQLAKALYRAGRQADALAVLGAARARLAHELGLDPGPEVRAVELRILQHDPTLAPTRRVRTSRPRTGPRTLLLASAVAVVAAGAAAAALLVGGSSTDRQIDPASSRLVSIDPASGRIGSESVVADTPAAFAAGFGSLWAADPNGEQVLRIDERTGDVTDRIAVGAQPSAITTGGGAVWVASAVGGLVTRIDPSTDLKTEVVRLGGANPAALVYDHGSLWIGDATDRSLVRIDPDSRSTEGSIALGFAPTALAADGSQIWAAGYDSATIDEVDLRSAQVIDTLAVGQGPAAVAVSRGSVWVTNSLDGTLTRIDEAAARTLATIPVGSGPAGIAASGGRIWVANEYSGTVAEVDPERDDVQGRSPTGGEPATLVSAGGRLWVGAGPAAGLHRGGTLTLAETAHLPTVDPAFEDTAEPPTLPRLAYDTLVTFDNAPGATGLRLVPDLALQLPQPTDGGRTYVFRLRPGIRYSNGRLLEAADFRRSFERIFRAQAPGTSFYTAILGAHACIKRPAGCDLSRGIVADDAARTVTFHLANPDPDFLFELTEFAYTAPIPPGTPDRDMRWQPIPGTGPYEIAEANQSGIQLRRNPYFHEWSHAAQPAGNPDAIAWVFPPTHRAEIDDVEKGNADWTLDFIPISQLHAIERTRPGLLHVNPAFIVEFIPLNTHLPPFDSVKVRQALNYAIDRRMIARLYGGPLVATPLCQPLAPGLPGYVRYCPYTANPDPGGVYRGPNLARARRLVAASGRRGARITVRATNDVAGVPPTVPRYVTSVLRSLGFKAVLRVGHLADFTPALRRGFQISVDGDWLPDFPSPASYLPSFFGCGGNNSNGYDCNSQLDHLMEDATAEDATDPARAAHLWDRADHLITDDAYWVPTVNIREVDLVSARLRNYEYNPVWGFLADQAWVR